MRLTWNRQLYEGTLTPMGGELFDGDGVQVPGGPVGCDTATGVVRKIVYEIDGRTPCIENGAIATIDVQHKPPLTYVRKRTAPHAVVDAWRATLLKSARYVQATDGSAWL
jgi:hypothetical protein